MNIINNQALARGEAFIDLAFSEKGRLLRLTPADYVGIVAAYIDRGHGTLDIREEIGARFTPYIGEQAEATFHLFDDFHGNGLWESGGSASDIRFTHEELIRMYPTVNEVQRRNFGS